jgi:hypothetical protein
MCLDCSRWTVAVDTELLQHLLFVYILSARFVCLLFTGCLSDCMFAGNLPCLQLVLGLNSSTFVTDDQDSLHWCNL